MSIKTQAELTGMQKAARAVAITLAEMRAHARPGMSTLELDQFGAKILARFGAQSAPKYAYNFPRHTCISVNEVFCHGIPSAKTILQAGDLVNIDVSARLAGFYADNGGSFVLGSDVHGHQALVSASLKALRLATEAIRSGDPLWYWGRTVEHTAKQAGYRVVRNLCGHGVGRALHEKPDYILNYPDTNNRQRFQNQQVLALETFISTRSNEAVTLRDGWTMFGKKGGFMAQHEHTIVVQQGEPLVLTAENGFW
jgi:methionyl aminopeptidase